MRLFRRHWNWTGSVRSLGVCVSGLSMQGAPEQLSLWENGRDRALALEKTLLGPGAGAMAATVCAAPCCWTAISAACARMKTCPPLCAAIRHRKAASPQALHLQIRSPCFRQSASAGKGISGDLERAP